MGKRGAGFTLIELLIVVAIIAILAAIAVPNFLEAQTRAKVSRAKADMRTLATGLEAYYVDHNAYIPNDEGVRGGIPLGLMLPALPDSRVYINALSTPVAYLTSALLGDPFGDRFSDDRTGQGFISYLNLGEEDLLALISIPQSFPAPVLDRPVREIFFSNRWITWSVGPDGQSILSSAAIETTSGDPYDPGPFELIEFFQRLSNGTDVYDPTNGTVSVGDVLRSHKGIFEPNLVRVD